MDDVDFAWDDESKPGRGQRLGTLFFVVLAVIAFELSSNASVGVAIACLKFAWEDACDGVWLYRNDPNKRRGQACLFIHFAVGLIKASLCGFLGGIAIGVLVFNFGIPLGWPVRVAEKQLVGALLVTVFGLMTSAVFGFVAAVFARNARIKLWVGRESRLARRHKQWPPPALSYARTQGNRVQAPLFTTIIGIGCGGAVGVVILVGWLLTTLRIHAKDIGFLLVIGMFMLMLSMAIGILVLRDYMKSSVRANHPFECWPEILGSEYELPNCERE